MEFNFEKLYNFEKVYNRWIRAVQESIKEAKVAARRCDIKETLFQYALAEDLFQTGLTDWFPWIELPELPEEQRRKVAEARDKLRQMIDDARSEVARILKEQCGCKVKGG